jgi:hypothetical protein
MYVPQVMVSTLRKAIRNGRRIERLLYRTGPELQRIQENRQRTLSRHPQNPSGIEGAARSTVDASGAAKVMIGTLTKNRARPRSPEI